MKFKIDSKISEQFPELNIGIVIAKGINNTAINIETILEELGELVQKFCGGEIKTFVLHNAVPEVEF